MESLALTESAVAAIAAWMPRQRWYAAKSRPPTLQLIGWFDLPHGSGGDEPLAIRTFLVSDEGSFPAVLYQVPVVARATPAVTAPSAHIVGNPEPGITLVDGPHDPAYTDALWTMLGNGLDASGEGVRAVGHPVTVDLSAQTPAARVLAGEQSNTSIIFDGAGRGRPPVICKIYRQLHHGMNPDIELQSALAAGGSPHVPATVGWIAGSWGAPGIPAAEGSLAFAQEFLPGVADAWRVALGAASSGDDFAGKARTLGETTAAVHRSLAELFPTVTVGTTHRARTAETWRRRLTIAQAEVPALAGATSAIEAVYAAALQADWPPLQRIHGDLHLGQVLHDDTRGWLLVDFEGEPLRPMSERIAPDLALRDVAGMLRSFDYVAGSIRQTHPDDPADPVREWAARAREGFLTGYGRSAASEESFAAILTALEIDKAVYEAIYESRNRPTWLAIPLQAISRLLARHTTTA